VFEQQAAWTPALRAGVGATEIHNQLIDPVQAGGIRHYLNPDRHRLGALHRLLMSQLRSFVSLGGVTARCQRVFAACLMGAFGALFRGGAVTLSRSFMMIGGGSVCISGHSGNPLLALKHEGAQCERLK
jgi:hypothetical protein